MSSLPTVARPAPNPVMLLSIEGLLRTFSEQVKQGSRFLPLRRPDRTSSKHVRPQVSGSDRQALLGPGGCRFSVETLATEPPRRSTGRAQAHPARSDRRANRRSTFNDGDAFDLEEATSDAPGGRPRPSAGPSGIGRAPGAG